MTKTKALAKVSQRKHSSLVAQSRASKLRIMMHPSYSAWVEYFEASVRNWNALNSKVHLEIVSTTPDITVYSDSWSGLPSSHKNLPANWCGLASWPGSGLPGNMISINMDQVDLIDAPTRIRNLTHEIGHALGMSHTNETGGTLIPGTPTTDRRSLMNGGQCNYGAQKFSEWDRLAVHILYPNRTDLIVKSKSSGDWHVASSQGTGFTDLGKRLTGFAVGPGYRLLRGDMDGDGLADLIVGDKPGTTIWFVSRSTGSGFATPIKMVFAMPSLDIHEPMVADVTGDGRADLIFKPRGTGDWYVAASLGTSFGPLVKWFSGWAVGDGYILMTGDVDGDGKSDLIAKDKSIARWYVAKSQGNRFEHLFTWNSNFAPSDAFTFLAGDVTGDGRADLITKENHSGTWNVASSDGGTFIDSGVWLTGWAVGPDHTFTTGDVTGDGYIDLITRSTTTIEWFVAKSTGTGFTHAFTWYSAFGFVKDYDMLSGDVKGP